MGVTRSRPWITSLPNAMSVTSMLSRTGTGPRGTVDHGARWQVHALVTGPPCSLKIGEQDHFATGELRFFDDRLGDLQSRTVTSDRGSDLDGVQCALQTLPIRGRPSDDSGALTEGDERSPIQRAEGVEDLTGFFKRSLELVADLHAVGLVEKDHDLAWSVRTSDCKRALFEERSGERKCNQSEGERAHRQQEPVLNASPSLLLERDLLQEHE